MKLFIDPHFTPEDKGDGGIRRVVEGQRKYLPEYGINIVENIQLADVVALHGMLWRDDTKAPVISHCHGLYWEDYEWGNWCYSMNSDVIDALLKADAITAPSNWIANVIHRAIWKPCTTLYHGIETALWQPGINEGYVLWNKTRVDPVCDPASLIELAERARSTRFVSTFALEAPNVKTTGILPFDKARTLIANAGVYLATTRETFGIGTLEAMACAVPILGYNWGGQREFIQHKENGYLVRPGDIDGLVEGLEYCQTHRQRLGQAARETVLANFDWHDVMGQYAQLYESVLHKPRSEAKVSVVIPCYNLARFLSDAVNSVLAQDYDDYEIIIVDDASTDDTPRVAKALIESHENCYYVRNETNQYLAGALNIGITAAKGKYIIPLDADNMLGQYTLKTLADHLDKHKEVDIVYGRLEMLEDNGDRWISGWPFDVIDYKGQLHHRNQCPSTSMYRKEVWAHSGGYRVRCHTAEDGDFWTRAVSIGKRAEKVTDAVTLIYRNRQDSMSHQLADWDWHLWAPQHREPWPLNNKTISTYEPIIISVVIPVGPGHSTKVIDAIDSLYAQSFDNWEVIVIDDNEDDYWLPPFVRRYRTNKPGSGPAASRNMGIDNARGNLVLFLDADDYLQPKALELMYKAWEPDHYVYCDWYIAETGEVHETNAPDCYQLLREMGHSVTMLVPKDSAKFDTILDAWEDWDYCLQLAEKGICGIRVPVPLLNYRIKSGGRREQLYSRMEELKVNIFNKWHKYMIGESTLMACGCQQTVATVPQPSPPVEGQVLIEFMPIGTTGTMTFRGKATGVAYRFGADEEHKIKYVHREDVPFFLQTTSFRLYDSIEVEPQLVAMGRPTNQGIGNVASN